MALGVDFCPAFWDRLVDANARGLEYSIEKVGDELDAGADELTTWATARGPGFFVKPDTAMLTALAPLSAWVTGQRYEPAAVNAFLQVADCYLVAHALAHKHVVVTHEVASASTKKIKNPNVCIGVDVRCMTPYEMLRLEYRDIDSSFLELVGTRPPIRSSRSNATPRSWGTSTRPPAPRPRRWVRACSRGRAHDG